MTPGCAYCAVSDIDATEPSGGVVAADQHWLVVAGDPASTIAGALRITSRRHFIHFADMTTHEATGFAALVARLDAALRAVRCGSPKPTSQPAARSARNRSAPATACRGQTQTAPSTKLRIYCGRRRMPAGSGKPSPETQQPAGRSRSPRHGFSVT